MGNEHLYKIQNTVCPQVATDMSLFSGVREGPPIEVLHMKARHDRDPSKVSSFLFAWHLSSTFF